MSSALLLSERHTRPSMAEGAIVPAGPSFFSNLVRSVFLGRAEKTGFTVLLTAPERGCGVSFASSCIVAELASHGGNILLADAQVFSSIAEPELAFTSCRRVGPGSVWVLGHHQVPNVTVISPHALISPVAVLKALRPEFSHIVIDTPALSVSDLALVLATSVEGVVLVAKAGKTETRAVANSYERLVSLGAHVYGSVYNAR